MPSEQEIQACKELGLEPDGLYDATVASQKLVIARKTFRNLRVMERVDSETIEPSTIRYRGWHIAKRHLERRARNAN